jgi:parallel beta-helix repeat protein
MRHASRIGVVLFVLSAGPLAAITVTNTNDSGPGSLRQAILDSNTTPGFDQITFLIAGAGVHTIILATPLPDITDGVEILGFTQPGSSENTNGPGLPDNSVHLVEIDGTNSGAGTGAGVLRFNNPTGGFIVDGLVINRAPGAAIQVDNTTGGTISGNFLGTDALGATAQPNHFGVGIEGSTNIQIGGTLPAQRNVISSNTFQIAFGCYVGGGSNHSVQGNFLGPGANGSTVPTGPPPGIQSGISLCYLVTDVTIGGPTDAERNVISGNGFIGVGVSSSFAGFGVTDIVIRNNFLGTDVTGALPLPNGVVAIRINTGGNDVIDNVVSGNTGEGVFYSSGLPNDDGVVQGNKIGTDASGTQPLPNAGWGLHVLASGLTIGGTGAGEANHIAYNGTTFQGGIYIEGGTSNTIRGNAIHDNSGLGIDLFPGAGVNGNDEGDGDSGPNDSQNFPVLESVSLAVPQGGVQVNGRIHAAPSTTYDLDFYSNDACVRFPKDFLEGRTYLGSGTVTTDALGEGPFTVALPAGVPGERISMTATNPAGSTSEFSQRLPFAINPASGPSAGGTAVTIVGTDFEDGATVTIGGQPAGSVVVSNFNQITATSPALAAGTLADIVVTNTQGTTGTLEKGWVADFLDVPPAHQFYTFVTKLVTNAITVGVGGGLYGVEQSTLRQQMAVFLLKAKYGLCYVPPPCTGTFPDVPCPSTFANWIEELAEQGITGGCGGGNYCPQNPVKRDQMAVFLLKTKYGSSHTPPACTGVFDDVSCSSPFAPWIEQLAAEQITGGCSATPPLYCPGNDNTRGQMAVFIQKTFSLP